VAQRLRGSIDLLTRLVIAFGRPYALQERDSKGDLG
jgi:hypothetical protein